MVPVIMGSTRKGAYSPFPRLKQKHLNRSELQPWRKGFKDELFMADCFHRVSLLMSCLFSDNSMLADTLCIFKHFS
jgi:hypothetical protein